MIFFPPAKINIGLHILDRYADGFHRIESFFCKTPLNDVLEIVHSKDKNSFSYSGIIAKEGRNLIEKATELFFNACDLTNDYFKIHLHKNIPIGAGLGGGSSDAAYCLKGLNEMCNNPLSLPELGSLASRLGSDCPFFLTEGSQYLDGRGEELEKSSLNLSGRYLLIIKPEKSIPTAWAYKETSLKKRDPSLKKSIENSIEHWKNAVSNDFEEVVFKAYPEMRKIKEELYAQGAIYASMSGSGSAFYGIFDEAVSLRNSFPDQFYFFKKISE